LRIEEGIKMEAIELDANKRKVLGKKVKSLRKHGLLPAVLYGAGIEPIAIELDAHETTKILAHVSGSTLINLKVGKETHTVILRDIQVDAIRRDLVHIDFLKVAMDTAIRTVVPVDLIGEAPAVKELGGVLVSGLSEVEIEALPGDLPDRITVDISSLEEINDAIAVEDIFFGSGVTILTDPEEVLAIIVPQIMEEEEVEEEEEEVLVDISAEPEVIEKGAREEEEIEGEEE
jgi:large subunit ribosomal protein L25